MIKVKKIFGQHFLTDRLIAERIANSLSAGAHADHILEIGPGKGVLTQDLLNLYGDRFLAVEIDRDLVQHLLRRIPLLRAKLFNRDFLNFDIAKELPGSIAIIGNFPYNISSQIIFKVLENKEQVKEVVGMFQKEMADRIVSAQGSKKYGIISVLTQCYYDVEQLFDLEKEAFSPPPKIKSSVIRLIRNKTTTLDCDEKRYKQLVKTAFGKRRKKLRNSLSEMISDNDVLKLPIFDLRPEQLSIDQFVDLTKMIPVN